MLTSTNHAANKLGVFADEQISSNRCCARPLLTSTVVNDVHSGLNPTSVRKVVKPRSQEELQAIVRQAQLERCRLSVAGGRHAMGGQQFGAGTVLVDMSDMNRVLDFNREQSQVTVEAGIQWPTLVEKLICAQRDQQSQVSIIQKQTGADRLSLGGALAANIHGRGLRLKPIIDDVESFVIVDAEGEVRTCSRSENEELFRLAIGGYGLFGIITSVTLRLAPRRRLRRRVEIVEVPKVLSCFEQAIENGALYGDFQFMTDSAAPGFLQQGIMSCYEAVEDNALIGASATHHELSTDDWKQLIYLAHTDRQRAWQLYAQHYLSTEGQLYWSDTHQLSVYLDEYHCELDKRLGTRCQGSEMITEVYVPRASFVALLESLRKDFRRRNVNLIYGTVRLIEPDDESFLAWAKEAYVCIVFNLHVDHCRAGIERAERDFRSLIDHAIERGGSYYLTYHRWATRGQVESCYPQFREFLALKQRYDPAELFCSNWYWHYKRMFGEM